MPHKDFLIYTNYFDNWPEFLRTWVVGEGGVATLILTIFGFWYKLRGKRIQDQKSFKKSERNAERYSLLREVQKVFGPCIHPGDEKR